MEDPRNPYFDNEESFERDLNEYLSAEGEGTTSYSQDFEGVSEGDEDFEDVDGGGDDFYNMDGDIDGEKEDADDYIYDIDFSQFKGKNFKSSLKKVTNTASNKKARSRARKGRVVRRKQPRKPLTQQVPVKRKAVMFGKGGEKKTTKRVIVPSTRKVIIEGADKFILGGNKCDDVVKNVGYYKGKKLKELVFFIHNNSAIDFTFELFNPSMPLDFLHSTSLNLNNKIQVAGGEVSYSDVMFNILGNPTHIPNAKFVFAGANVQKQISTAMRFKNKNVKGEQKIEPLNLPLNIDNLQVADDIVFFDIDGTLNRPFIPNGMDVIEYTVYAGNTVTLGFFYEQKDLRKFFYKEARQSKKLI